MCKRSAGYGFLHSSIIPYAMTPQETSSRPSLGDTVVRYLKLLVEDTRLSLAEKLTRLLSALAVCAIVIILATVAVVFITIGVSVALAPYLGPQWSLFIVAGVYVLLIAAILVFKSALVVNPIARFISRLILQPPVSHDKSYDQSTTVS